MQRTKAPRALPGVFDIFPKDRIPGIALAMTVHLLCYYLPKLINPGRETLSFITSFDLHTPLIPAFIIFYVLAFVQWIANYIVLARESEKIFGEYIFAELLSKLICMTAFLVIPSEIPRAACEETGIFASMLRIIYFFDAPTNTFPSMHCCLSYMNMRAMLDAEKINPWWKILSGLFTIGVVLSTVFTKQHVFLDTISGIFVAEVGIFLGKVIQPNMIFHFRREKAKTE